MNKIANRKVICDVLMEHAKEDKDIVVLCSDSRGSASMTPFFDEFPAQSVEVGIAEQDLVGIAAGLAKGGKKPFALSPASFISARSYEQCKVDCAYSDTNVKLIGISGGVSYGALGMSHHSAQDIAAMSAIPNMRVYLPSDRHQTKKLFESLLQDEKCAYIRTGRNPVEDVYTEDNCPFEMNHATWVCGGEYAGMNDVGGPSSAADAGQTEGETADSARYSPDEALTPFDAAIIACGEMVYPAKQAAELLREKGLSVCVLDMYCVKPIDKESVIRAAESSTLVVTAEEHSPFGGLGSMVSQIVAANCPKKVINLALPDEPVITGTSKEVFDHYGLNAAGIAETVTANI